MNEHLYLTGYRGTGKTSVATIVAQMLNCVTMDLDDQIEQQAGKSIRDIFDEGGEPLFRHLETEALCAIPVSPAQVISLGGGAILAAENRQQIQATGRCVWLDASAEVLAQRIHGDASSGTRRPSLTSLDQLEEIRTLLIQRREHYHSVSQRRIDTDRRSVQDVAQEVLDFARCG